MNTHDLREGMNELARDIPDSDFGADDAWRLAQRTRHRRRWSVVAAAAAAVVAIGAGTWLTGTLVSGNDNQYLTGDELPFATYHGRNAHLAALEPAGKLVLEEGCLYITTADNEDRVDILLPDDTSWDPARQELSLDGHTLRVGEVITFGGSTARAGSADHIPASCRDGRDLDEITFWQVGDLQ